MIPHEVGMCGQHAVRAAAEDVEIAIYETPVAAREQIQSPVFVGIEHGNGSFKHRLRLLSRSELGGRRNTSGDHQKNRNHQNSN